MFSTKIRSRIPAAVLFGLLSAVVSWPCAAGEAKDADPPGAGIEVVPRGIYALGAAPLGQPLTVTFRLRNPDASQPMEIRSFHAEAAGFAVEPPAGPIPAGETVPFQVTLLAEEVGEITLPVTIYLETSDYDPLVSCLINGEVIAPGEE